MPLLLDPGSPSGSSNSSKRSTNFTLTPVTTDDVRRLVDIEFHAFENERCNQQLSFRDYTKPEHFERSVYQYNQALSGFTLEEPRGKHGGASRRAPKNSVTFYKVVDMETGDVVSFAKAEVKTYTPSELLSPDDIGHEHEPRMNRDWYALNERMRRAYLGMRPHCYIAMLATEPCHQHHGAGTMLLKAILAEADEAGIEVYLEGTDTAKPLYEKHGFEAVNEILFNPAEYGVCDIGRERQTIMVRGARRRDGSRARVRAWDSAVDQAAADLQSHVLRAR